MFQLLYIGRLRVRWNSYFYPLFLSLIAMVVDYSAHCYVLIACAMRWLNRLSIRFHLRATHNNKWKTARMDDGAKTKTYDSMEPECYFYIMLRLVEHVFAHLYRATGTVWSMEE